MPVTIYKLEPASECISVKLNLPQRADATFDWEDTPPDPLANPEYYDGLLWRRPIAFAIDLAILAAIMATLFFANIVTFGLLGIFIAVLWPVIILVLYDTFLIGGPGAGTVGMRCVGLEVRSWQGARPTHLQAAIMSAIFCLITPWTAGLILVIGLFSDRRRLAHDFLSGTVVINRRSELD
ncbi:MAG TPA: RDD family protein [Rhodospirillaceae bacterium]|nr:hypothetical protein [Rhodospirillaceae bacterium]HAT34760.1 RDD family protein [Rhodospirillaceae bacterium]